PPLFPYTTLFRSRPSFCASELSLQRFCVGRRIHAGGTLFRKEHMNTYTIFQWAQLLQRLCALQWTPFPSYKLQQRVAPEAVDALMTKIFYFRRIAGVGDRCA